MSGKSPPVAAAFVANFLKPEMRHVYRQVTGLQRYRSHVLTFKRENEALFSFPANRISVIRRSGGRGWRRFWYKQLLQRPLRLTNGEAGRVSQSLQKCQASLLHLYFGHIGVLFLPWLERAELPSVLSFHGADVAVGLKNNAERAAMREAIARASLILARSDALKEDLTGLGCDPGKIRIHRAGLPLHEIRVEPHALPSDGKLVLIQACRFIAKKGLHTTLKAFAEFAADFPKASLLLAGDGPLRSELERFAESQGIKRQVEFTGFLDPSALARRYAQAHIFLHPSETGPDGDREGVPNSLIEAMAAGLPVIGTRHGGIPEAVQHDVSGLLVEEKDPHALAAALGRMVREPDLHPRLSSTGAAQARAQFDSKATSAALEGFYDEAVGRFHITRGP